MISIYVDKQLNKYKKQIEYSLDYIFNIMGYDWKILEENDVPQKKETIIYYTSELPENETLEKLSKHFSLIIIFAEKEFYCPGSFIGDKLKESIKSFEIQKKTFPVISKKHFEYPILLRKIQGYEYVSIEFDLIGNLFFHLSEDELNHAICNETSKSHKFKSAFQDYYNNPFLARLAVLLDKTIQEFNKPENILVKKCIWPKNEKIAFTVSHNVDSLHKWKVSEFLKSLFVNFFLFFTLKWGIMIKQIVSQMVFSVSNIEPYWNFEDILEKEKYYKTRSTWFLSNKTQNSPEVDYALDDEELKEALKELVNFGSELAFLVPKKASLLNKYSEDYYDFVNKYKIDKCGIRHSHLINDCESFCANEREMNILYDSTKEPASEYGFVNGTCFPYKVWDKNEIKLKNKPIWEVPVNFNEKAITLSKYKNLPIEIAKTQIRDLFSSVKELRGLLHVSFNISSFTEIPYLYKLYAYILDHLSTYNAYKGSIKQIIQWLNLRQDIQITCKENKICLYFPEECDNFTFQFFGGYKFMLIEGANGSCKEKRVNLYNIQKDTSVTVHLEKEIEYEFAKF